MRTKTCSVMTVLVLAGAAQAATPAYSDRTNDSQVIANHSPAYFESFLAGGTVADFDGDGWQDVFVATGGDAPDRLFMNNQDGTFTDRAADWNIAIAQRSTAGAAGDYNGDGLMDLYVTSLGPASNDATGHHKLYRNNGNGTFTDVASTAGVNQTSTGQADGFGAAWGDYDLDGDLDLAVAGWRTTSGDRLFRNDGNGSFTDVTTTAQLTGISSIDGFAPRFVDMNGDRYPELIWIGDFGSSRYYVNDTDGTFTEFTSQSGTGLDGTEMGITVTDVDEDGDFDFYVSTIGTNNLYINQGNHVFVDQANAAGVDSAGWGWAVAAIDLDHDTKVDLVSTTQSGRQYAFHNVTTSGGPLDFDEIAITMGLVTPVSGRGMSNLDYDNDGDQDLVFFPYSDPIKVFRNDVSGADTNWLRVFLDRGSVTDIAPNGIGSVVRVTFGTRTLTGRIDGGSNYLSQSEMSAHFGLGGTTTIDELRVEWTNGDVTTLTDVAANQTITITPDPVCTADLDGNGNVGFADLSAMLSAWGACGSCAADLNGDGIVGFADLSALLAAWGTC